MDPEEYLQEQNKDFFIAKERFEQIDEVDSALLMMNEIVYNLKTLNHLDSQKHQYQYCLGVQKWFTEYINYLSGPRAYEPSLTRPISFIKIKDCVSNNDSLIYQALKARYQQLDDSWFYNNSDFFEKVNKEILAGQREIADWMKPSIMTYLIIEDDENAVRQLLMNWKDIEIKNRPITQWIMDDIYFQAKKFPHLQKFFEKYIEIIKSQN